MACDWDVQSSERSAGVQFPGSAVPQQDNLVPNASPCLHCTTHLGGWKLYVNSTTANHVPVLRASVLASGKVCVYAWVSLFTGTFLC